MKIEPTMTASKARPNRVLDLAVSVGPNQEPSMQTTLTDMPHHPTLFAHPSMSLAMGSCPGLRAWYFQEVCAQVCELRIKARNHQLEQLSGSGNIWPTLADFRGR
jgi:hypothetical protein